MFFFRKSIEVPHGCLSHFLSPPPPATSSIFIISPRGCQCLSSIVILCLDVLVKIRAFLQCVLQPDPLCPQAC